MNIVSFGDQVPGICPWGILPTDLKDIPIEGTDKMWLANEEIIGNQNAC